MPCLRMIFCLVAALVTLAGQNQPATELWQGAFTLPSNGTSAWGGMELYLTPASHPEGRLKFTPGGRLEESEAREFRLVNREMSFSASIAGKEYRFTGRLRSNRWTGKMSDSTGAKGKWNLSKLDLRTGHVRGEDVIPAPSGPSPTGRTTFHWIDKKRPELETSDPDDSRELLVYLFYPAEAKPSLPRAEYIPERRAIPSVWSGDRAEQIARLRSFSRQDAPILRGGARFPVAIFMPGGGQKVLTYTVLLEDLASHGYMVAAIEPPYNAPSVEFPGGRMAGRLSRAEVGWPPARTREEFVDLYQKKVVHWVRDMSFVLDELTAMDCGSSQFARRFDLARAGAYGHSRGGQAAGTVRLLDTRFRGGINLDGNESGKGFQPITGGTAGKQPFLWIQKQMLLPTERQLQQMGLSQAQFDEANEEGDRLVKDIEGGGVRVTIARPGIDHADFADNHYWNPSLNPALRAGKLQTLALTRTFVRTFFDGCLRDDWSRFRKLLQIAGTTHPEVSVRAFGILDQRR